MHSLNTCSRLGCFVPIIPISTRNLHLGCCSRQARFCHAYACPGLAPRSGSLFWPRHETSDRHLNNQLARGWLSGSRYLSSSPAPPSGCRGRSSGAGMGAMDKLLNLPAFLLGIFFLYWSLPLAALMNKVKFLKLWGKRNDAYGW